ncbi:unnamed protein product, partial [Polarella glacialis]
AILMASKKACDEAAQLSLLWIVPAKHLRQEIQAVSHAAKLQERRKALQREIREVDSRTVLVSRLESCIQNGRAEEADLRESVRVGGAGAAAADVERKVNEDPRIPQAPAPTRAKVSAWSWSPTKPKTSPPLPPPPPPPPKRPPPGREEAAVPAIGLGPKSPAFPSPAVGRSAAGSSSGSRGPGQSAASRILAAVGASTSSSAAAAKAMPPRTAINKQQPIPPPPKSKPPPPPPAPAQQQQQQQRQRQQQQRHPPATATPKASPQAGQEIDAVFDSTGKLHYQHPATDQ